MYSLSQSIAPSTPISAIVPTWAWQPWSPSDEEPWNEARVQLMFRRGGFGASPQQRREALRGGPKVTLAILKGEDRSAAGRRETFELDSEAIGTSVRTGSSSEGLAAWWLHRMLQSPSPLLEKMTLFWHGHFATGAEKVMDAELMYQQNQLLRRHALGDFRPMVQAISRDPAMLIYLDSVSNRKAHPNENYARELMELFCLGEGNYSEQDVQQLARCFTGWEIRRKMFRFNPYQHDSGLKTIFDQADIESGEDAIDCVLARSAMPRFVCTKLVRYFVCDEPNAPDSLIAPLADQFVRSGYSIGEIVDTILQSRWMLSQWSVGRKIRSPVEFAMEWMRSLEATTNLEHLARMLRPLGQAVFYPPNVKGWDGGRAWINSSTLIGRSNFVVDLLGDPNTRFDGKSLEQWCSDQGIQDHKSWIDWLNESLLAIPLSDSEYQPLFDRDNEGAASASRANALITVSRIPKFLLS